MDGLFIFLSVNSHACLAGSLKSLVSIRVDLSLSNKSVGFVQQSRGGRINILSAEISISRLN
jgi:hypothetical protein